MQWPCQICRLLRDPLRSNAWRQAIRREIELKGGACFGSHANAPGCSASSCFLSTYSCMNPLSSCKEMNASFPITLRALTRPATATECCSSATVPFAKSLCSSCNLLARCVRLKLYAKGFLPASLSSLTCNR